MIDFVVLLQLQLQGQLSCNVINTTNKGLPLCQTVKVIVLLNQTALVNNSMQDIVNSRYYNINRNDIYADRMR